MKKWQNSLAEAVVTPEELAERFDLDYEQLSQVAAKYPMRITRYYLDLIKNIGDPIWRQCVPDPLELEDDGQVSDPLNEEGLSPVPDLIHRYPDRAVWLISSFCPVYCRFCMRKRSVGSSRDSCMGDSMDRAISYIEANHNIRDVILSGGDPLLLEDNQLDHILCRLRTIPHVELIRIGTRVPVTLPERITAQLCRMLKRHHPLYINTHFNHPTEITAESFHACAKLADSGIPLGNQTVLLRGVNDNPAVMKDLMQLLLSIRVRPYYLHQMDLVRGTGHFRTTVETGLNIMKGLRGFTSGLANPQYVIDLPGGKGKTPLLPDNCFREGSNFILKNYLDETVEYRDAEY